MLVRIKKFLPLVLTEYLMERNFKAYTQIYFLSSTEDKRNFQKAEYMNIGVSVNNLYEIPLENAVKQVN